MKLFNINRRDKNYILQIPIENEFIIEDSHNILTEAQEDFLANKYPEVSKELILKAINYDRRNAERLILGIKQGIITDIDAESLDKVKGLDPYAKSSNKSAADLAYDEAIKDAKKINPKYWMWILKIKKSNPEAQIDEGIFHYLEEHDLTAEDIKDQSLGEVLTKSQRWHNQEFASQNEGGSYKFNAKNSNVLAQIGSYSWVPVPLADAKTEGEKMQNCIGRYCKPSDTTKIFSLRNKFNNPHVSLSIKKINNEWVVSEIKGKQNRVPIPKYTPFVMSAIDKLVEKDVKLVYSSDIKNLPNFDYSRYIDHYIDYIIDYEYFRAIMSNEQLNDYIKENGLSSNLIKRLDDEGRLDKFMQRLTRETYLGVLLRKDSSNSNRQKIKPEPGYYITILIRNKLLTEEEALELLSKYDLSRSYKMVLKSAYKPEEFFDELKKLDIEDLIPAMNNYIDAIKAYPGKESYFLNILIEFVTKSSSGIQHKYHHDVINTLLSKLDIQDLVKALKYNYGFKEGYSGRIAIDISEYIMPYLVPYILALDTQSKIYFLSTLPATSLNNMAATSVQSIIYSIPFENLIDLYKLNIEPINKLIKSILRTVNLIKDEVQDDPNLKKLSGTSDKLAKDIDLVLHTDDAEKLRQISKSTKSRGVKILVARKLARLERLNNVTS